LENTSFEPDYDILPGIASKSFKKIKDKILNTYLLSEILALLSPIGVSFTMIKRIAESESNISLLKQKILENPYMLTRIPMLSFKKVDAFAIKLHPDFKNSKFRMMAAIQYEMEVLGEEDGHTWVEKKVLRSALKC
jgi:exodeoxyribonuclease V alpha subunit